MKPQVILGIDPGYGRTGYGVVRITHGNPAFLLAGCIETHPGDPLAARLKVIYNELGHIIARTKPDEVALEKLFFAKNTATALRVAETRGVILLLAEERRLPMREFTPLEVKMAVSGYGRAEKRQVQYMVAKLLDLVGAPKPDDAADALAIAITASAHHKPVHGGG